MLKNYPVAGNIVLVAP